MKMHSSLVRGAIASAFFFLVSAPLDAAPRDTTSPVPQIFLRVTWDDNSASEFIEIYGWNHEVVSPRDAASGLPTGKRQHKPLTVMKQLDRSTPLFRQAFVSNKALPAVEVLVVQTDRSGNPVPVFTIRLNNATVADTLTAGGLPNPVPHTEEVSFVYEEIEWNWGEGGTTATDSWVQP